MIRTVVLISCAVLLLSQCLQSADAVEAVRRLSRKAAAKASRATTNAAATAEAGAAVSLERVAIDPRTFDMEQSSTRPLTFFNWESGQRYVYRFSSKAAHMSAPLPAPQRVNPQIALEDLGLFPFAVLEGTLILDTICVTDNQTVTFEARINRTRVDCGEDTLRPNSTCPHLYEVGKNLTIHPFWFTMNARGEIISLDFTSLDDIELSGIKRNMVHELALTMPAKNENANLYARYQRRGRSSYATRYRVRPFTRQSAWDSAIDGLIVRKERALSRPSWADREIGSEPAIYHRFTWVYMVIGGEVDVRSGAAAVPTRMTALEQTQIDPRILAQRNASAVGSLYVISRLELNLRRVLPGTDRSAELLQPVLVPTNVTVPVNETANTTVIVWVNGTEKVCVAPQYPAAKPDSPAPATPMRHTEPSPALSFLETSSLSKAAAIHLPEMQATEIEEEAPDNVLAKMYEDAALAAWL